MSTSGDFSVASIAALTPGTIGDVGGPEFVTQTDHVTEAQELLLAQFRKTKIEAHLAAMIGPTQDLEDVAAAVYSAFDPYTAVGKQLDVIGWIVGVNRKGRSDDGFRPYVLGRIAANKSDGAAKHIYRVARMLIGDDFALLAYPVPPACYTLEASGGELSWPWNDAVDANDVADKLADMLIDATSLGVRLELIWQISADADSFTLADADAEQDDTAAGFASGDDDDSGTGGDFVGVKVRE